MYRHLLLLQKKAFLRSASLSKDLFITIFMSILFVLGAIIMVLLAIGVFVFITEKLNLDPVMVISKYLIYWIVYDLVFRYFWQKMPIINIKPLLLLPFKKNKIVFFAFSKTVFTFFNGIHAFFFIPFSYLLITKNDSPINNVILWNIGLIALIYCNNFLNILLNKKNNLIYFVGAAITILGGLQYAEYFDITTITEPLFYRLYESSLLLFVPIILLLVLIFIAFRSFVNHLYLDAGLASESKIVKTENLNWIDRFGRISIFLKNDIKLIKRNKRARVTIVISILFLLYGLLFFSKPPDGLMGGALLRILGAIFVTGGFLFSFGQTVPSWDSSYYLLLMTQNIRYKEYLSSKWWLMVIATFIATILASVYLYYGWEAYLTIIVVAIYNMGVNSHLILWSGAYVKTPVDLDSFKKAFGDKQAYNLKTLVLTLPKIVLPVILYAIGHYAFGPNAGYALIVIAGIIGFAFRNFVFSEIEKTYKKEKYKTISAYKK